MIREVFAGIVSGRRPMVSLDYDVDVSVELVLFGHVVYRWPPEEFKGWGSPLALLYRRKDSWHAD